MNTTTVVILGGLVLVLLAFLFSTYFKILIGITIGAGGMHVFHKVHEWWYRDGSSSRIS